jgi:hypothetical protein
VGQLSHNNKIGGKSNAGLQAALTTNYADDIEVCMGAGVAIKHLKMFSSIVVIE